MDSLLRFDLEGLRQHLPEQGFAAGQAAPLFRAIHRDLVDNLQQVLGLNKRLGELLNQDLERHWPTIVDRERSHDGSVKWSLAWADGASVETVFIPEARRGTLCLSSQVGCSTHCRFCHTGTQGLGRNLSTVEIVTQALLARRELLRMSGYDPVSNVVMMGMGEPLFNWPAVSQALRVVAAGLGVTPSSRRLSISTVGVLPNIAWVARDLGCNLVVSLHAATDAQRNAMVPLNRQFPLAALRQALADHVVLSPRRDVTLAYLLLDGVNDSPADAEALLGWIGDLPARVNLLTLNPWPGSPYRPSPKSRVDAFHAQLVAAGLNTHTRRSRGEDIAAACGQLAAQTKCGEK